MLSSAPPPAESLPEPQPQPPSPEPQPHGDEQRFCPRASPPPPGSGCRAPARVKAPAFLTAAAEHHPWGGVSHAGWDQGPIPWSRPSPCYTGRGLPEVVAGPPTTCHQASGPKATRFRFHRPGGWCVKCAPRPRVQGRVSAASGGEPVSPLVFAPRGHLAPWPVAPVPFPHRYSSLQSPYPIAPTSAFLSHFSRPRR